MMLEHILGFYGESSACFWPAFRGMGKSNSVALEKVDVKMYSTGIPEQDLRRCHVDPIPSVEQGIGDALAKHGKNARITVIPSGPYVIPYVRK